MVKKSVPLYVPRSYLKCAALSLLIGTVVFPHTAHAAPDAGTLLHNLETTIPAPSVPVTPAPSINRESAQPQAQTGTKVLVKDFHIEATRFTEAELKEVVKEFIGKELTLAELQEAALKVGEYYRAHGFLARAYLPRQTIKNGIVTIIVLEGKVENITVDPKSATRLDPDLAIGLMESRMPLQQSLRPDAMQEGVMLLNSVPGVAATATLEPGTKEGGSVVTLNIHDAPLVSGVGQVDNGGVRSVGQARTIAMLAINDPLGRGEQATVTAVKTEYSNYGHLALTAPAGYSGLTLGINGSLLNYTTDHDFSPVAQTGSAYTAGLTASYPITRSLARTLTAQVAYDLKHLSNALFEINSSIKDIHVGTASLEGLSSDTWQGGGANNFNLGVALGHLDLSGNASNRAQDSLSAKTEGMYGKFLAGASRLQTINAKTQFFIAANGQIAAENLDSSEQISLGGPDGVRAYPANEAFGDTGFIAHTELRRSLADNVQLIGFYDAGWIEQHATPWTGWNSGSHQPNDYWLEGAGAGASVLPTASSRLSATLAYAIGPNDGASANSVSGGAGNDSDGHNKAWRLWLQASIIF